MANYPHGYFGIGIYQPRYQVNTNLLWRSALLLGADFMFTIGGEQYKPTTADTTQAHRHLPVYTYVDFADFEEHLPVGAELVCLELTDKAKNLIEYKHPKQVVYLLGSEVQGLPAEITDKYVTVKIPMEFDMSMNVAFSGSIVLYDRLAKAKNKE